MTQSSSQSLFEPQGVTFNPVKRSLAVVRRLNVSVYFVIGVAAVSVGMVMAPDFPREWGIGAIAGLSAGWLYMMWVIGRQVRNFAWAQGEHDFLIRRGAFFRSMTIVPYGRIQYVDISEGPVSRFFGISTVIIHTASVSTRAFVQGIPSEDAARLRDQLAQRGSAEMAGL